MFSSAQARLIKGAKQLNSKTQLTAAALHPTHMPKRGIHSTKRQSAID